MEIEQILESVLDNLAEQSVNSKNHKERTKKDKTAYAIIRELYNDVNKIKYWDQYYLGTKRCLK